jgi:hypothetical protein
VPVTVRVYWPAGVFRAAETVRTELPVPPDKRVMESGLSVAVGPCLTRGEMEAERLMVPVKPLMLVTLIVELPECPVLMVMEEETLDMLKSGGDVTVTNTVTECDSAPLVPVTVAV